MCFVAITYESVQHRNTFLARIWVAIRFQKLTTLDWVLRNGGYDVGVRREFKP
jgi:hypothetical protein